MSAKPKKPRRIVVWAVVAGNGIAYATSEKYRMARVQIEVLKAKYPGAYFRPVRCVGELR